MIPISENFKIAMKQPVKEIQAYISGDTNIKSEDDLISFKISCDTGMCKTAMRKLEAKYLGEHNLLGQWVHVGYGVRLTDGTFEYLDYGSFLINEITTSKDTGVTTIVGYDKMINSMKNYSKLNIEYPINILDYSKILCEACDLELGDTEDIEIIGSTNIDINTGYLYVENLEVELDKTTGYLTTEKTNLEITNRYLYKEIKEHSFLFNSTINRELWENINGITYRDILVQIAQATGTTCIISNDDKVYFKPLMDTGESLTYDNLLKLKLEPKYGEINSVVLSRTPQEDNIYKRDEESIAINGLTEFRIENNEIVDKDRDNFMAPIYEALKGISYYPFEATTEGLGWYEIGDNFNIINDTGDVFNTSLFNFSITIDGGIKEILKTVAETKTQTQYQYASTMAKRIKNAEIIVNKQEQYIEQLVTDMYEKDGVLNENFTKVYQDIDNIVNSVQNSGGNNLIKNSVMFAFDNDNDPKDWGIYATCKNISPTDYSDWVLGQYTMAGIVDVYTNRIRVEYLIPCKPNTAYYFNTFNDNTKFILRSYYADKTFHGSIGEINNGATYTTTAKTHYLGITIYNPNDTTSNLLAQLQNGTIKPFISLNSETNKNFEEHIKGSLVMGSSAESLNAGCLSGHIFTLSEKIASQKISVNTNTYYTFSTKIRKSTTGTCYVKLYNSKENYIIEILAGENVFFKEYELKALLPKDDYYIIEFYGSADSNATFTDNMLAIGEYKTKWTQANGEIMNTQVNVSLDGVLVKSSVYLGDYTIMSPLEFAGYSYINGVITKVFSLNKDITLVKKLEAEDEVKMVPIKIVPVTSGDLQGWAFVPST